MTDMEDKNRNEDAARDQEKRLRERVEALSRELDEMDHNYSRACDSFRLAVSALGGVGRDSLTKGANQALDNLLRVATEKPIDPDRVAEAVDQLKSEMLKERRSESGSSAEEAARHVSLAILQGLRLGEPTFDAYLDKTIADISQDITSGRVRPAMSLVVDVMDRFRERLDKGRRRAETALKEILIEVMEAEEEQSQAYKAANDTLVETGERLAGSMTDSMTYLAKDITAAADLTKLKSSALLHIRTLRDLVKERREEDTKHIQKTQEELTRIRGALDTTRSRMAEVEKMRERLRTEALTDPMTGIWNKRAMVERVDEALANPEMWPLSLVVLDIDYFKSVNDTYGHQAGDRALKAIAKAAGDNLRPQDVLFRYAGDEFVILLVQTNIREGKMAAERVRKAAENIKFTFQGQGELRITITLGLAEAVPGDSNETLFAAADKALLEAKQAGRNRVGVTKPKDRA